MSRGEGEQHRRLKTLALTWVQASGFEIAAAEVRVPKSGYRADVAAYSLATSERAQARTAVLECKQARADLLKDAHVEVQTRARLAELMERKQALEKLLAVHRPDLRRGEALWPEFDAWDFSALEHRGHRAVIEELETVQRRLQGGMKFSKMFRYRCADFLYLVVEDAIFAEAEIPAGWGLLVREGDGLRLARSPAWLDSAPEQRTALLESIAIAGTKAVNRAAGITVTRPGWTSGDLPGT